MMMRKKMLQQSAMRQRQRHHKNFQLYQQNNQFAALMTTTASTSTTTTMTKVAPRTNRYLMLALVLIGCMLHLSSGERDFNFNETKVPLLEAKDDPKHTQHQLDPYVAELLNCHYIDNEIVLSLVLEDHDWSALQENKKAKVLEKLSKFFAIPKEYIIMETIGKYELNEMQKESLRKGTNKCKKKRTLGRVNIVLGCSDKYFSMAEPIVNQIGQQIRDGSIDNISGEHFGWWVIWHRSVESRAHRHRRQASEGSGEGDYDDDYDYEGEEEEENNEPVTIIPAATQQTPHAHRHHHGDVPESTNDLVDNNLNANEISKADQVSVSKIDEEIVESVSQLESVISKTIENTKHIKDVIVPEVNTDDENDERVDDIEKELKSTEEELQNGLMQKSLNHYEQTPIIDGAAAKTAEQTLLMTTTTSSISTATTTTTTTTIMPNKQAINFNSEIINPSSYDENLDAIDDDLDDLDTDAAYELQANSFDRDIATAVVDVESSTAKATVTKIHDDTINSNKINALNINNLASASNTTPSNLFDATAITTTIETTLPTASSTSYVIVSTTTNIPQLSQIPPLRSPYSPYSNSYDPFTQSPTTTSSSASSLPSSSTSPFSSSSVLHSSVPSTPSLLLPPQPSSPPLTMFDVTMSPSSSQTPYLTILTTTEQSQGHTTLPDGMEQMPNITSVSSPTSAIPTSETLTPLTNLASSTTTTLSTPEPTTPSTISEYAEPRNENTPPMIHTRLPKINVTAGKYFSTIVPDNVFHDNEDLTNLRLDFHDKDGHEMKQNSWVQFNAETREIYGLPVFETPSTYFYYLTATDSGNETVTETVEIKVMQHRFVRTFNHEINITVKVNDISIPNVDWQIKLIKGIAATLGDMSTDSIVAPEVRLMRQEPNTAVLAYFNETFSTVSCPENELNDIVRRLDANRLDEFVQPTLSIKSILGKLIGGCRKMDATPTKPPTMSAKNLPPVPRNQVDRVNATVGHLLVYPVPPDTFYDANDNQLTLTLKTKDNREISPRHWLQFDSKNQEFYGIPKSADIGTEEYLLVAEDSGGLSATDALVVVVSHAPKKEFIAYFKAYLAIRHEQFNANLQRKFVESISELFGDRATNYVQIRSVTTHHDSDGTIVNFYNTTLFKTHNRCPEAETEAARSVYLAQDYTVRNRVKKILGPELNLTNVQVIPLGSCHPQQHDFIPPKIDEPLLKSSFSDDYFYTFILPAAIIVVMIIIASIIACCLHRRRRKSGKMELGDEEERKSFRAKGIPVIFQDELDEKPEIGNKSPIILKDEKPPLLPPSYNTSNMTGDNDVDEYVPPPAVVVGGREARGKSPATPSYRRPPPYVSP